MRIGEVAKISRCPAVTIRYYEKIGLLPNAKRTAANYRIYDQNDLERRYGFNFAGFDVHRDLGGAVP